MFDWVVLLPSQSTDDGRLSYEEFKTYFDDDTLSEDETHKLFSQIDTDGNGYIDTSELAGLFHCCCLSCLGCCFSCLRLLLCLCVLCACVRVCVLCVLCVCVCVGGEGAGLWSLCWVDVDKHSVDALPFFSCFLFYAISVVHRQPWWHEVPF